MTEATVPLLDGIPWGVVGALSPSAALMIVFFMVMTASSARRGT